MCEILPPPPATIRRVCLYLRSKSRTIDRGFTLIEMAIVIVVIGLGIGGFLVGKDLISAAEIRAQIGQYEEYNAGLKTFKLKYNALAGDMPLADAAAFGLSSTYACNGGGTQKLGNGKIDGCYYPTAPDGEQNLFWRQLGDSGLIGGKYNFLQLWNGGQASVYGADVDKYLPKAKIGGNSSHVYVWGNGPTCCGVWANNGKNYMAIGAIPSILYGTNGMTASASLTPAQAFAIDTKIDDGFPQSGKIIAAGAFGDAEGGKFRGAAKNANPGNIAGGPTTAPVSGDSTTCYDNGGAGGTQQYSIKQNGGANITCVVSFEFQ